jgi:hypothetical protein
MVPPHLPPPLVDAAGVLVVASLALVVVEQAVLTAMRIRDAIRHRDRTVLETSRSAIVSAIVRRLER